MWLKYNNEPFTIFPVTKIDFYQSYRLQNATFYLVACIFCLLPCEKSKFSNLFTLHYRGFITEIDFKKVKF